MSLRVFGFCCGSLTAEFARVMEGGDGDVTMPVPAFLIEHPKGRAVFDTGLHPACQHDPAARIGEEMATAYRIGFDPGQEISAQLEAIGRDPGKIDLLINSHFHFDHVGGNALVPNATMVVQRREWEASRDPDKAALHGYDPRDFDVGHTIRLIDGEFDVFGDGSVTCLPTPVTSAEPCATVHCPDTSTIATRCSRRSTGWRLWNAAVRDSSSATIRDSAASFPLPPKR